MYSRMKFPQEQFKWQEIYYLQQKISPPSFKKIFKNTHGSPFAKPNVVIQSSKQTNNTTITSL